MILEVLRAGFAILFLLVLPGYFLSWAIFPDRRSLGWPTRAVLTLTLSISAVILVGALLGFLPPAGERGWFQTMATGLPFFEATLFMVTAGAAVIAYERDAFPGVRERLEAKRAKRGADAPGLHGAPGREPYQ